MTELRPFDPTGPLPEGRMVLEASAGTGKTWAIAALVVRYVAESDVPIDRILVVTFTRAATSELRDRVRRRLVEAGRALEAALDGRPVPQDVLLAHLVHAEPGELEVRLERINRAVASFDQAVISTIHGFAGGLLRLLGMLSTAPLGVRATGDLGVMTDQVLSDLMVREFAADTTDLVTLGNLASIAGAILGNPDAGIVPEPGDATGEAAVRTRLARAVRSDLAARTQQSGVMSYDDLLVFARDALLDPHVGAAACRVVRSVFDVALVDEFQDTDRIQWDIISTIFGDGHGTSVIIGDPKQAIYAFRGADVEAYLAAVDAAGDQATLSVNWRSDGPLLTALEAILGGVSFGSERIAFQRVDPAPDHMAGRVTGVTAPVQIRVVSETLDPATQWMLADTAKGIVAGDTAGRIVELLSGSVTIPDDTVAGGVRGLRPSDIAVLCRKNAEIDLVESQLIARGVPAVKGRTGSVLVTPAAHEWLALLGALERTASPGAVRRVLIGPFFGWTPQQIATADDETMAAEHDRIAEWAGIVRHQGIPALLERADRSSSMTARVLAAVGGERLLTDLLHVAEILHSATRRGGVRSLAEWLATEISLAETRPEEAETRLRRLETDDQAVQLLTIHTSKGLEFPVVMVPFGWVSRPSFGGAIPVFHDPSGRRVIDVGGATSPDFDAHKAAYESEQDAEDFRLLYVAVTRARHHLGLWWAPNSYYRNATLTKVLFGRDEPDEPVGPGTPGVLLPHAEMLERLAPVLSRAGGTIEVRSVTEPPDTATWVQPTREQPELRCAAFEGRVDRAWWRWSFTSLSSGRDGSTDTGALKDDEPDELVALAGDPLPMGSIPGGLRFGTMVHEVFEHTDFVATDLPDRLTDLVTERARYHGLEVDVPLVASGLQRAIETPLGAQFMDRRLRDIDRQHRLDEMYFELPVHTSGGDPVRPADIGRVLAEHLPADDPLASYAARVEELDPAGFHGFLTGAIDLTLQLPDAAGGQRWWVADYKTNRLPTLGGVPTTSDYGTRPIAGAMLHSHYALQALLYQIALHRYLRVRLPDYQPARDLGGALYLFVRGMIGPDTPQVDGSPTGVFGWGPNPEMVLAMDALFGAAP